MSSYACLSTRMISELIRCATQRIIYAAPGVDNEIASSISESSLVQSDSCIHVVIDPSPEICRFGYGSIAGIEKLIDSGINVSKINGFRIGLLVVDNDAYLFTPIPSLLEDDNEQQLLNCVPIRLEYAEELIDNLIPNHENCNIEQISENDNFSESPEGYNASEYRLNDLSAVKDDLAERPPKNFDTERMVRIYNSYIQFVELRLSGIQLHRRTIPIPTKLLSVSRNSEVQDRLKATYKLINENSNISSREIENKIRIIRKRFTHPMGSRLGSVILLSEKETFLREIDKIRSELMDYSNEIMKQLQYEIQQTKNELVKICLPGILLNPPDDLRENWTDTATIVDDATRYILYELENVIPSHPEQLVKNMSLYCDFKDVTYEMLNDQDFQMNVFRHFRYPKLYK